MFSSAMASPEQLATLTKVFDDFVKEAGIEGLENRDEIAQQIITLFNSGITDPDEIKRQVVAHYSGGRLEAGGSIAAGR